MILAAAMLPALLGGLLIGLSVALLLLYNGRIAGISGILAGTLEPNQREWGGQALFVVGLLLGGIAARRFAPSSLGSMTASPVALAFSGLLVGFGTRLSGGCTSGHGVCGVSRLEARSLIATSTFIAVAMGVVFLIRHGGGS